MNKMKVLWLFLLATALVLVSCDSDELTPTTSVNVAENSLRFTAKGESQTLSITSNSDWRIEMITEDADWLDFSMRQGKGDSEITLTASENLGNSAREASFNIITKNADPITIQVIQGYRIQSDVEYETIAEGDILIAPMEVGSSTVVLNSDARDYKGVYFIFIVDKNTYDYKKLNPENIADYAIQMGNSEHANYSTPDNYFTFTGNLDHHELYPNGPHVIYPNTEMYLVAFGVDESGSATTPVSIVSFTTKEVVIDENFLVNIQTPMVKDYYAQTVYTPNDANKLYYRGVITTATFNQLGSDDDVMNYICQFEINADALLYTTSKGVYEETIGLEPNTAYTAVAFAYESGTFASKLSKANFTTTDIVPFNFFNGKIDFTIDVAQAPHITVSSNTNGYTSSYFISIVDKSWYENMGYTPETFMPAAINMEKTYMHTPFPAPNGRSIFTGNLDHYTITDMTFDLEPGTYDYVMGVVGVYGQNGDLQSQVNIIQFSIIVDANNHVKVVRKKL